MKNDYEKYDYESDNFLIKNVEESEKVLFGDVAKADFQLGLLYYFDPETVADIFWNNNIKNEDNIYYSVYSRKEEFIGCLGIQNYKTDYPEVAITLCENSQGKGYGAKLLKEGLNWIFTKYHYPKVYVAIDKDNVRSKYLFEKIGAILDDDDKFLNYHIELPLND